MHTEAGGVALLAMCYSLGLAISPFLPQATGRASRWPSRTEPPTESTWCRPLGWVEMDEGEPGCVQDALSARAAWGLASSTG